MNLWERPSFSGEEHPAFAKAVTDTLCYTLPQESFEEILIENPDFAAYFTKLLTERLHHVSKIFNEEDLSEEEGFKKRVSDIMTRNVLPVYLMMISGG